MNNRQRSGRLLVMSVILTLLMSMVGTNPVSAQEIDDRAHVSWVQLLIDDSGNLWLRVITYGPWDGKPPKDLFSFFILLNVVVDGQPSSIGYQIHDGVANIVSDGAASTDPHAYILEDGYVLVATGLKAGGVIDHYRQRCLGFVGR